jgi:hypothetical protein
MEKVNVDPEHLKKFAGHLKNISQQLTEIKTSTDHKLNELDWNDAGYKKFEERYRDGILPVNNLLATFEEFIRYLYKKADLIEQAGNY